MNELYSTVSFHQLWWKFLAGVVLFALGTIIPHIIFKNKYDKQKFTSRRWYVVVAWYCLLVFVLLLDGEFIKSGIASTITIAAVVMSGVFMLSSTLEKFTIKKGDIEINGKFREKQTTKTNSKKAKNQEE
jgi:hypothetical protein